MTVKHTRPEYKNAEERKEKLQETRQQCMVVLGAMQRKQVKRGA